MGSNIRSVIIIFCHFDFGFGSLDREGSLQTENFYYRVIVSGGGGKTEFLFYKGDRISETAVRKRISKAEHLARARP